MDPTYRTVHETLRRLADHSRCEVLPRDALTCPALMPRSVKHVQKGRCELKWVQYCTTFVCQTDRISFPASEAYGTRLITLGLVGQESI